MSRMAKLAGAGAVTAPVLYGMLRNRHQTWWQPVVAETHPHMKGHSGAAVAVPSQTKKVIVLVDMDGTIADFDQRALQLMKQRHGKAFDVEHSTLKSFPFAANFDASYKRPISSMLSEENFFRSFQPIDGAIQALKEMQAHESIEVFFCTAPIRANPFCASEKMEWIREHLGDDWVARIIITSDKSLVRGDILIDDAPQAKGDSLEPVWEQVWFRQPYNIGLSGKRHLKRWSEWRAIVFPLVAK